MSESFADLFEESLKEIDMQPGSIVQGTVVDVDNDWVTVNAGLKSEGVIPLDEFKVDGEITVQTGDTVEVAAGTFEPGSTLNPGGRAMTIRGAIDVDGNPTTERVYERPSAINGLWNALNALVHDPRHACPLY